MPHPSSTVPHAVTIPKWANALSLALWLVATVSAFLPFAVNTSAWNAVTLNVPGNQGNWWHVLVGLPFFLPCLMLWLRLRTKISRQPLPTMETRIVWIAIGISICGTVLVELPFLLHLAGTSAWQRLAVLSLGFGIVVASAIILFLRRRTVSQINASFIGLDTGWLANAALCLVVYSDAPGNPASRIGWFITVVIVWPIALELVWLLAKTFRGVVQS